MHQRLAFAFLMLFHFCFAQPPKTPAVCYEIFVRSFADSDGDGIGDLNGITAHLPYLQKLGIKGIWLTPICTSPSYHKYDVVDYYKIDPEYGTLADFKQLLNEAHKRGMEIFMDLVINHTSNRHPWFAEAEKGKDNPYHNYYNWLSLASADSLVTALRKQMPDSWEIGPWYVANENNPEKYYGLFTSEMPDLNYDNPKVREEVFKIGRYWLQTGVDGFRLDAAKHIYPEWEAEKSHAFWQEFRRQMETVKPDVYLVGEVMTTADKVAPYLKGLTATFDFDLHSDLIRIISKGKNDSLVQVLKSHFNTYAKYNPYFVDATLLTNHDQDRIASELKGDKNKLKVAANLLLTLPGQPYLYYGEELGMLGAKPDESIREPFLWQPKEKDSMRTHWSKVNLMSTDTSVHPLSVQQTEANSLYHHYQQLIAFRESQPALKQVSPANMEQVEAPPQVVAFIRPHPSGSLLVVQNLGGTPQTVKLKKGFEKVVFETGKVKQMKDSVQIQPYGLVVLKERK